MARERRGAGRWAWIGAAALVVMTPLAIWVGVVAPRGPRYARLDAELEDAIHDFRRQRWERPVLRGEPAPGNAYDAQMEAVAALSGLPSALFDDVGAQLAGDEPITAGQRASIEEHAGALARYRASTQRAYSWGDYAVERGFAAPQPDYMPHLRASRALLLQASMAPPRECLAIVADVVRLGQDRAAGMGLVPLMVHSATVSAALPVAAHCIGAADRPALGEAARALAILARHPAPTGSAIELELLLMATALRRDVALTPGIPIDEQGLERWWNASHSLEAWELIAERPSRWRDLGADYPTDIDRFETWQRDLHAHDNAVIVLAAPAYDRYLRHDAGCQAAVLLMWAAARVRLTLGAPPARAPAVLAEPELADPTTGAPFHWTVADGVAVIASPARGASDRPLEVRIRWPAPTEAEAP